MQSKLPLLHSCPGGVRKSTFRGPWRAEVTLAAPSVQAGHQNNPAAGLRRKPDRTIFWPVRLHFSRSLRRFVQKSITRSFGLHRETPDRLEQPKDILSLKRFNEKRSSPMLIPLLNEFDVCQTRKHYERGTRRKPRLTQLAENFNAVRTRHHQINQGQAWTRFTIGKCFEVSETVLPAF